MDLRTFSLVLGTISIGLAIYFAYRTVQSIKHYFKTIKPIWFFLKRHGNYKRSLFDFILLSWFPGILIYPVQYYQEVKEVKKTSKDTTEIKTFQGRFLIGVFVIKKGKHLSRALHMAFYLTPEWTKYFINAVNSIDSTLFMEYPLTEMQYRVHTENEDIIDILTNMGYQIEVTTLHLDTLTLYKSKKIDQYVEKDLTISLKK